jgi:hypothetical protein
MFFGHAVLNAIGPPGKIFSTHETPPEVVEICTARGLTEVAYWPCTFIFIAAHAIGNSWIACKQFTFLLNTSAQQQSDG